MLHKLESSAHTSSARVAPVGPIGLTTEAKSGNQSDKDCRPHLELGSKRFAESIDRGQLSKLFHSAMLSAFMVTAAMPAFAQTHRVRVGGITCVAGPRAGLVLGSRRDLQCVFRSDITGRQYAYAGKIRRIGLDVGITRGGRLCWAVFAPTTHVGRSTLRGSYRGASGNVALGVGVGAKVLIGGARRTVSLQALSVEGQIGINLALGVTNLSLR